MRVLGIKLIPLILASVLIYIVGALIYGVLFSAQWMALSGYTPEMLAGEQWRMALSPIMPIMITVGMGLLIKDRGITTLMAGLRLGVMVGVLFLVAARLYNYAYGNEPLGLLLMDSTHLMANAMIAGAVLGAMKAAEYQAREAGREVIPRRNANQAEPMILVQQGTFLAHSDFKRRWHSCAGPSCLRAHRPSH